MRGRTGRTSPPPQSGDTLERLDGKSVTIHSVPDDWSVIDSEGYNISLLRLRQYGKNNHYWVEVKNRRGER